jgi:predicted DNA-binding ribbon-helix-helix protein
MTYDLSPAMSPSPATGATLEPGRRQAKGRAAEGQGLIRRTLHLNQHRTSTKLEAEFWALLEEMADEQGIRLSVLVTAIMAAAPTRTNLASTLRTAVLRQVEERGQTLRRQRDRLVLAGSTQDLARVVEACPLPCLVLDWERTIRQLNRAFARWLDLDPRATLGQRLDAIPALRVAWRPGLWAALRDGQPLQAGFIASHVAPGRVRTVRAVALTLATEDGKAARRGCVVMFDTLAGQG